MRNKNDLFYQCINDKCVYFRQLIVYSAPLVTLGLINLPNLRCDCGWEPLKLKVRGE